MARMYLFLLGLSAISCSAAAQELGEPEDAQQELVRFSYFPPAPEPAITVLANGVREPVASTGQALSVFDRSDICRACSSARQG